MSMEIAAWAAVVVGVLGVAATLYASRAAKKKSQIQSVREGGLGIQAGRDVRLGNRE